jgi:hypothetical protein
MRFSCGAGLASTADAGTCGRPGAAGCWALRAAVVQGWRVIRPAGGNSRSAVPGRPQSEMAGKWERVRRVLISALVFRVAGRGVRLKRPNGHLSVNRTLRHYAGPCSIPSPVSSPRVARCQDLNGLGSMSVLKVETQCRIARVAHVRTVCLDPPRPRRPHPGPRPCPYGTQPACLSRSETRRLGSGRPQVPQASRRGLRRSSSRARPPKSQISQPAESPTSQKEEQVTASIGACRRMRL